MKQTFFRSKGGNPNELCKLKLVATFLAADPLATPKRVFRVERLSIESTNMLQKLQLDGLFRLLNLCPGGMVHKKGCWPDINRIGAPLFMNCELSLVALFILHLVNAPLFPAYRFNHFGLSTSKAPAFEIAILNPPPSNLVGCFHVDLLIISEFNYCIIASTAKCLYTEMLVTSLSVLRCCNL